jgi:hypothetical protein
MYSYFLRIDLRSSYRPENGKGKIANNLNATEQLGRIENRAKAEEVGAVTPRRGPRCDITQSTREDD